MTALYASPPVLKDRSFELTTLGPYILAWQDWLEYRRIAQKTRDNYEQDMSIVAKAYRHMEPGDFTAADLMALSRLFPPKARDVRMASVKSFFAWATVTDVIDRNPFDKVPSVRYRSRRKDYDIFTEGEVDALLCLPIADGALMGIMLEAGLRKAECRNLQVRRLVLSEAEGVPEASAVARRDFESVRKPDHPSAAESTGELVVIGGKGDKDRTVQFGPRLHGLLQELLFLEPMEPNDYLWYCRPGGRGVRRSQPILEGSFDFWWKRCLKAAGVRYRKPHTTRHTYATRCLRRGMPLTILSKQLGHSSIATTFDEYGHLDNSDVRREVLLMEER